MWCRSFTVCDIYVIMLSVLWGRSLVPCDIYITMLTVLTATHIVDAHCIVFLDVLVLGVDP